MSAGSLAAIEAYKATMFFAPPTVWIGMLRHPDFGKHDLSSLVKCYYGASIHADGDLREILEKFPGRVYNYYGQTDWRRITAFLKAEDAQAKIGSAGTGRAAYGIRHRRRRRERDHHRQCAGRDLRPPMS